MKFIIFSLLFAFLSSACASHTQLSDNLRSMINQEQDGRIVALNRSMYYGQFYEDNRYILLSEWPFEYTSHLANTKGAPISPKNQVGIIPIGTRVKIVNLEFPDKDTFNKRMIFTPRYHPWVILELVDTDPFLPKSAKPFVLLLPMEVATKEQVEVALDYNFGDPAAIRQYLNALPPLTKIALEHKEVETGMSYNEVLTAYGKPLAVDDLDKEGVTTRTVTFGHKIITLVNDKVTAIKANPQPQKHNTTL